MTDVASLGIVVEMKNGQLVARQLDDIARAGEKTEKTVNDLSQAIKGLVASLGLLKLLQLAEDAHAAGAEFERLGAIVRVTGAAHGYTAQQLQATEKALREQSMTLTESREAMQAMIRSNIDLSNASKLAAIAQDVATHTNAEAGQAYEDLVRAIETGMDRSLKMAGINLDLGKAVANAAQAQHIQTDEFTQAQLQAIRLNAVLDAAKGIQGSWKEALSTTSQTLKEMHDDISDVKVMVGLAFGETANGFLQQFAKFVGGVKDAIQGQPEILFKIVDGIKAIAAAAGAAAVVWGTYYAAVKGVAAYQAIVVGVETITAFLSLAKAVRSLADAMALVQLVGKNAVTVIASIAAAAVGYAAYKKLTEDLASDTEAFAKALDGLGGSIKTTNTGSETGVGPMSDRLIALRRAMIDATAANDEMVRSASEEYVLIRSQGVHAYQEATTGIKEYDAATEHLRVSIQAEKDQATAWVTLQKELVAATDEEIKRANAKYDATLKAIASTKRLADESVDLQAANAKTLEFYDKYIAQLKAAGDARDALADQQRRDIADLNKVSDQRAEVLRDSIRSALDAAQGDLAGFFDSIVSDGVQSFSDLASHVQAIFVKLAADLAAMKLTQKIFGGQTAMSSIGGLDASVWGSGITEKFATGVSALTAGIATVGAGIVLLVSQMASAAEKARQLVQQWGELGRSVTSFGNVGNDPTVDIHNQAQALRDQAAALFREMSKNANNADEAGRAYIRTLADINAAEKARIAQLEEERAKAIEANNAAIEATIAQQKLANEQLRFAEYMRGVDVTISEANAAHASLTAHLQAIEDDAKRFQQQTLDAQQEALSVAKAQLDAQKSTVTSLQRTLDTLKAAQSGLLIGSQSILSPIEQYRAARSQLDAGVSAALGGDQSAAAGVPDLIKQFLQLSQSLYASTSTYGGDFTYAQGVLDKLTDKYSDQLTTAQLALAQAQKQTDYLSQIVTLLGGNPGTGGGAGGASTTAGVPFWALQTDFVSSLPYAYSSLFPNLDFSKYQHQTFGDLVNSGVLSESDVRSGFGIGEGTDLSAILGGQVDWRSTPSWVFDPNAGPNGPGSGGRAFDPISNGITTIASNSSKLSSIDAKLDRLADVEDALIALGEKFGVIAQQGRFARRGGGVG